MMDGAANKVSVLSGGSVHLVIEAILNEDVMNQ
jgi:hypothetical protein